MAVQIDSAPPAREESAGSEVYALARCGRMVKFFALPSSQPWRRDDTVHQGNVPWEIVKVFDSRASDTLRTAFTVLGAQDVISLFDINVLRGGVHETAG